MPSVVNGQGRGVRRRWGFSDVVALYLLRQLSMIGVTPEVFRPAIEHLRGLPALETDPPEGLFIDRDGTVHSGSFPDPEAQRQAWLSEGRFMVQVPIALAVQDLLNQLREDDDGEATAGLPRGGQDLAGEGADRAGLGAHGPAAGAEAGD